jgi:hypothetical protein
MSRQLHSEFSNTDQQALQNQRQDKTLQTLHIDGYLTFPNHSAKNDRLKSQARFVPKCSAADISYPRLLSERRSMPRYPRSAQNRDLSFHTPAQPLHSGRCLRSQPHSHFRDHSNVYSLSPWEMHEGPVPLLPCCS